MFEDIHEYLKETIDSEGKDLKFKIGDTLFSITENQTPTISYDYLITDNSIYSFLNPEFTRVNCELHPSKSDYQIYFEKVKSLCKKDLFEALNDTENFKLISLNNELKEILKHHLSFDINRMSSSQIPQFGEIRLYTNKQKEGAPRVFFFVGSWNIIYILFYDSRHSIFSKSSAKNN